LRSFGFVLLDVVLTEIANPEFIGVLNGTGGKNLGDRDQADVRGGAVRASGGIRDPVVYGGKAVL
jgi:hypothetical protein